MNAPKYNYSKASEDCVYIFLSVGAKGTIPKVVIYEQVQDNLYNLAFGDYDPIAKEISDEAVSNNANYTLYLPCRTTEGAPFASGIIASDDARFNVVNIPFFNITANVSYFAGAYSINNGNIQFNSKL